LRKKAKQAGKSYTPDYIEKVAQCCWGAEPFYRVLYYDCAPYAGTARLPISGEQKIFNGDASWLDHLAMKPLFAVRRGTLKFRGFSLKKSAYGRASITDQNFEPEFEQKGVDMRIGLDIATYSLGEKTDLILFLSEDTDLVPALKLARREGVEVRVIKLPNSKISPELMMHVDGSITIPWPTM